MGFPNEFISLVDSASRDEFDKGSAAEFHSEGIAAAELLPACDLKGGPVLECTIAVSAGLESLFTEGLTTTCEVKGDLVEVLLADCILEVDPAGDWAAASDPEYDLLTGLASASDVGGKGVVLGGSGTSAFMF